MEEMCGTSPSILSDPDILAQAFHLFDFFKKILIMTEEFPAIREGKAQCTSTF